ncbi:MAG: serine/threonine-protein kinase, partial [Planctomycetota bacterium]
MDSSHSPKRPSARTIFEAAIELTGSERGAYLDETCGPAGTELRSEVDELLSYHDHDVGEFFDTPAIESLDRMDRIESSNALLGQKVGQYQIQRLIATGGMGSVFEAVQESPERRVAVKILRRDVSSPTWLKRFELEGQILARLRHPGVTQIYEAGVHRDALGEIPFFAMELIDGVGILDWVKEKNPSVRERLSLFVQVCSAIEHAHQNGVIHRDLKPQNLLVDGRGQAKVLDFGISRSDPEDSSPQTQVTQTGQVIGTVAYMSPEQISGHPSEVDTRTDVYALGAVLFEVLSGEHPYVFDSQSLPAMAATIRERDPRRLGSVAPLLRGDLDTILEKALEKNKERRYRSVSELSQDLTRYLRGEPILARPPSAVYQIRKLVGRHRLTTGFLAVLFLVLVSFGVFAVWK